MSTQFAMGLKPILVRIISVDGVPLSVPDTLSSIGLVIEGSTSVNQEPPTETKYKSDYDDATIHTGVQSGDFMLETDIIEVTPATVSRLTGATVTAAGSVSTFAINNGGTGYLIGDKITAVQAGGSGAVFEVTGTNLGVITSVQLVSSGAGYQVGSALPTTTDSVAGEGALVNITAVSGNIVSLPASAPLIVAEVQIPFDLGLEYIHIHQGQVIANFTGDTLKTEMLKLHLKVIAQKTSDNKYVDIKY